MDQELIDRITNDMRYEFQRTAPPDGVPGFHDISTERHTSDLFHDLEQQYLWPATWAVAGRASDVAHPGDYFTFDDLGVPLLIVRGTDGVVRCFCIGFPINVFWPAAHVEKIMRVNWKACQEAFMESYHVVATHPTLMETLGDANTRYDTYGNFSRAISPQGVESPHLANMAHYERLTDGKQFARYRHPMNGHIYERVELGQVKVFDLDDDWTLAPELGATAKIFQQDSINLPLVQRGLKAQEQQEVVFANYNETKIRHFWEHLHKWLKIGETNVTITPR